MADPRFFDNAGPLPVARVAEIAGANGVTAQHALVADVATLETAGPGQLAYCDSPKFKAALERTRAGFVLVSEALAKAAPATATPLICEQPSLGFAKVATALYPNAHLIWPATKPPVVAIAPTVRVGEGTVVAPGVYIGEDVEIGDDCIIAPGVVIGRGVRIGHKARLGPHVSISHALIGDRCIIHAGARIGQDGFSYIGGASGHFKIPQLGRVIIQDDVEIGANVAIDRGAIGDTVIGEGTKIDNLVQIGHNNRVGRRCIIVSQVGVSGSCEIGDYAVLGGQVGVADHVKIGSGATVAAKGGVTRSLEGGQIYGGFPARPVNQWRREVGALARLAKRKRSADERNGKD